MASIHSARVERALRGSERATVSSKDRTALLHGNAYAHVRALQAKKEIATGVLYIDGGADDMHAINKTVDAPLVEIPFAELCPGSAALNELMEEYR